jgi:hypothetical protein
LQRYRCYKAAQYYFYKKFGAMKKISILLFTAIVFFSCGKEKSYEIPNNNGNTDTTANNNNNNNSTAALTGDWNFINLYMDVSSTATGNFAGQNIQSVTAYKTTSINNTGALSFTTNQYSGVDMGYSISTTIHVSSMGVTDDVPFDYDIPPYSATGKYQKIGNDSLYFPNGSMFGGLDVNGQQITASAASGVKYAIKSDTLYVYANMNETRDTTMNYSGVRVQFRMQNKAAVIGSFKRK